jgi:lysophospholipase
MNTALSKVQSLPDRKKLQQALLHLDLAVFSPLKGVLAEYVQFYDIDFEKKIPQVRHYCGWYEASGYRIAGHIFLPESPKGTVFILHGYLDHSGLYRHMINECLQQQFAVFIYDQPGHGLSSGASADISSFEDYQHVLQETLLQFGTELPSPFYAVGLSMGGGITMDFLLSACAKQEKPIFQKALLLAPLIHPAQWWQIRFGYHLIRVFKKNVPRVFRQNSSDQSYLAFVRNDPLQARNVPFGWIGALREWEKKMRAFTPCHVPILLVQGDADETVSWRYNNCYVREHFQMEYDVLIPNASHQLVNERDDLRQPVHTALRAMLGA